MKEVKKEVFQLLYDRLSEYGFEHKKNNNYVRVVNSNVLQIIGFTYSSHSEKHVTYINPVIGLLYKDIDALMVTLTGWGNRMSTLSPIVGSPIGFLMPERTFIEWRFAKGKPVDKEVNKMGDVIIKYGLPYLDRLSDKDNMIYEMEINGGTMCDYILPMEYYLRGNKDRACSFIDEVIKRRTLDFPLEEYKSMQAIYGEDAIQIPPNKELDSYLPFAEKFKKMIEDERVKFVENIKK